jgi:predicted neuraminidase
MISPEFNLTSAFICVQLRFLTAFVYCITASASLAAEPGRTDEDLLRQPGVVSAEYIFERAPYPSCHASTIVETPAGLVAAWFGGTRERNPDVGIWLARQENGKWTTPVEVANGVQSPTLRYPTWNPVLFQPKSGPLLLFYKVGPSPADWWGMIITSDDGGRTWSQPKRLPDGILGPIKNKPVDLENGDILAGSSTESGRDGWRVHFERSTDGGKTWTATEPVNDGHTIAAIQPSILFHKDGRLQSIGRTRNSHVFEIWSDDNGNTWGPMSLTPLPNPSSGTDAVTLADGRQLLVYNHTVREGSSTGKSRGTLNVAISDDGKNWNAALVLEKSDGEFSYPAVIQTADGLVHITYTWKRNRVKHVIVDPSKLKLTPITDGKWPET